MGYIENIRKKIGHDPIFMPASGCILIQNNQILLQKRSDDGLWGLHGGALEFGESFNDALYREMKEEINIKPIKPILMKVYSGKDFYHVYPNGDMIYPIIAAFIVRDYEGIIQIDNNEVLEVKWFDLNNLPKNLFDVDKIMINDTIKYLKSI